MNVQHDQQETQGKFYVEENGDQVAIMTYKLNAGNIIIEHTTVDESLRGKNVGAQLVKEGVKFARDKKMKIIPVCTYAKRVLERGEEYKDVLAS